MIDIAQSCQKKSEIELSLESILTLCRGRVRGVLCVLYFVSCKCHTLAQLMKSFLTVYDIVPRRRKSQQLKIFIQFTVDAMLAAPLHEFIHEFMCALIQGKKKIAPFTYHSAFSTSHVDWNSDKICLYHLAKVLFNIY